MNSSPKNENYVINYSPVRQIKIFLMNSDLSDPPIDSNVIIMIKVQKCSKDIGKIINVTSVVL